MTKIIALTVSGDSNIPLAIVHLDTEAIDRLLKAMDLATQASLLFGEKFYAVQIFDHSPTFYLDDNDALVIDDVEIWDPDSDLSWEHEGNHKQATESILVGEFIDKLDRVSTDGTTLVVKPDDIYWHSSNRHTGASVETALIPRDILEDMLVEMKDGE